MTGKELERALNRGIVVRCETAGEFVSLLKAVKECGGSWLNGNEIVYNEQQLTSTEPLPTRLHISRDYKIGYVMGICFHYGAYPTVDFRKFKTDRAVIDVTDETPSENKQ